MSTILPPTTDGQDDNYVGRLLASLRDATEGLERATAERGAIATLAASQIAREYNATGDAIWLRDQGAIFKDAFGPGATKFWHNAGLPHFNALNFAVQLYRHDENDGPGRWAGLWPLTEGDYVPRPKTPVVYQLLDGDRLLYIGSTLNLTARLGQHSREKEFSQWRAARCESEQACRDLETALIDAHRPPMNRMIPKPRVTLAVQS